MRTYFSQGLDIVETLERPWKWVLLSMLFLTLDFVSGVTILFPITFIFPVALAAWQRRLDWAISLAAFLSLFRVLFELKWDTPWTTNVSILNGLINLATFTFVALVVNKMSKQALELRTRVKVLEGVLPICAFCKKIRNEDKVWQPLESYISDRSDAGF